ncbi:thiol-activated cytolysin family protein [Sphingobacterium sp. HMA12]|uniref:thiol-activated cytolysin family protein n=1 Tax=Sphingobacterium sp. HMA12 TaxID=2050894 RepID=UPI000CEA31E2|nr:thiol-activated cytolysin family protein [Sphingobacterium sp. HMA12]
MKKTIKILFVVSTVVSVFSCKKNEIFRTNDDVPTVKGYVSQFKGMPRYSPGPIKVNVQDTKSIYDLLEGRKQTAAEVIRDSVWSNGKGRTLFLRSNEIPALTENIRRQLYLGAILKGEDAGRVENFVPVSLAPDERNPITIYATFPTDSTSRVLTKLGPGFDKAYIQTALKNGSGEQLQSFSYDMASFNSYQEMKLSFNANLNIAGLFKLTVHDSTHLSNNKTRVRAEFTQENFSVNIEPPIYEPFVKPTVPKSRFGTFDPVIVSSVTYGRKGIMTFESDSSYKAVNTSITAVFNLPATKLKAAADGQNLLTLGLSQSQVNTINNAQIKVYLIGPQGKDIIHIIQGVKGFASLIANGGEYSWQSPGTPLYYSLNYMSDFSTHWTNFQVDTYK